MNTGVLTACRAGDIVPDSKKGGLNCLSATTNYRSSDAQAGNDLTCEVEFAAVSNHAKVIRGPSSIIFISKRKKSVSNFVRTHKQKKGD